MSAISRHIRKTVRQFGIDLRRVHQEDLSNDRTYDLVLPRATYSPWNKDPSFKQLHKRIQQSTLVDEYRCFELWEIVKQVAKLPEGDMIEIGVWRGGTGMLIAQQAKNCGMASRVFLCDTFAGVVKAGENDTDYKGGEHKDTSRSLVEALANELGLENIRILQGIFPDQTGFQIEDLKFRFCHIDVDVYESAKEILSWVWTRLVKGGIVVYDDYGFKSCAGITKHVEEQMNLTDRLVLHNLNGHAIVMKLD